MTRARLLAGIALAVMSAAAVPAPHAAATTYYEYWSYWHKPSGAGAWQYSNVGPSGYYLNDKTPQVEGWRFAVGTASPSDPQPRPTDVSYDAYCAGKNTGDTYRVLLVVDYGTMSGAPAGPVYSCYGYNDDTNGYQVLAKHHPYTDSSGLICSLDSYPKTGCGQTVSSPAPRPAKARTTTQPPPTHAPATSVAAAATTGPTAAPTTRPASPPAKGATPAAAPAASTTATTATGDPPSGEPTPRLFAATAERPSSFPVGLVIGLAGLAALVGGTFWMRRRTS